jgi:uncharacterized protein YbaP (TraB family)
MSRAPSAIVAVSLVGALLAVPTAPRAAEGGTHLHFLWAVDGGSASVHLIGSVHALREDDYPLPPLVDEVIGDARVAAFEVDLEELGRGAVAMMARGMLPSDTDLREQLSEDAWTRLEPHLESSGLPQAMALRMRPWLLSLTLTALELERSGFDPTHGVDRYVWNRARANGAQRVALETVEDQVDLFSSLEGDDGEAFLLYSLEELETVTEVMDELAGDWRIGRLDRIETMGEEAHADYPELMQRVTGDRNRKWLPKIVELVEGDQPAVVVVGALHLLGDDGLVKLLEAEGYTVTQR